MNCKVLRENIMLQVEIKVESTSAKTIQSIQTKPVVFNESLQFDFQHKTSTTSEYDSDDSYGRSQTKTHNIVLIRIQKVDKDDKCTYQLKLTCPEFKIKESILYSDDGLWRIINENTNTSSYTFNMTFHVETLTQIKFSSLYDDDELTDFKLKAHDGEISIHKAFLAAVSPKFKAEVVKENENLNTLDIPDVSVKTLQDFKKCIYMDMLPTENLEELLLLASYFKISWLEYKCVDNIMKDITKLNAMNLLQFALEHKHMPLFLGIMDCVQSGVIKMGEIRKQCMQQ